MTGPSSKRGSRKPIHPEGVPVVSTLPTAASMLGLNLDRFSRAVAAARVEPWPWPHADGSAVYPWGALVAVARQLGATVPYPPRGAQALTVKRDRGRRNRYQQPSSGRPGRPA